MVFIIGVFITSLCGHRDQCQCYCKIDIAMDTSNSGILNTIVDFSDRAYFRDMGIMSVMTFESTFNM